MIAQWGVECWNLFSPVELVESAFVQSEFVESEVRLWNFAKQW